MLALRLIVRPEVYEAIRSATFITDLENSALRAALLSGVEVVQSPYVPATATVHTQVPYPPARRKRVPWRWYHVRYRQATSEVPVLGWWYDERGMRMRPLI